jgi:hypothetical protein
MTNSNIKQRLSAKLRPLAGVLAALGILAAASAGHAQEGLEAAHAAVGDTAALRRGAHTFYHACSG